MTLVDTNVLIDIWTKNPDWGEWSAGALSRAASRGVVEVNPVTLAELSVGFQAESDLLELLAEAGVRRVALPPGAAWVAGQAFVEYRKRGGARPAPLPDFFIGAHAQVENSVLLTRDPKRYRTYFPKVKLIAPR